MKPYNKKIVLENGKEFYGTVLAQIKKRLTKLFLILQW